MPFPSFNIITTLAMITMAFLYGGCGCCCHHHMPPQPEPLVDGSRLAELQRQQEAIDASGKERLGNMILAMDEPTEPSSSSNDSYTVSEVPEVSIFWTYEIRA
ncbi:hypothetical protein FOZ62_002236 [Perkinsus olseni]|uniref:Secreted protein n=1 Tax=Perkinsus olseni TaxID=32597 RepID=A0A7J6SMT5_PEROL|nr:hypothetical protein FOZ62_002236 [Perkinsus olseni]